MICLAAELPTNFWEFAERMATKLISMTVKEGEKIISLEKLYERKPSMDLIRTFGCHAFTHVPQEMCSKTDLVSRELI